MEGAQIRADYPGAIGVTNAGPEQLLWERQAADRGGTWDCHHHHHTSAAHS